MEKFMNGNIYTHIQVYILYTHIYVYLNYFAMYLKYYKSTILQLKK